MRGVFTPSDNLFAGLLIGPVAVLVLTTCVWGWWHALNRLLRGRPLLDQQPRQAPPWGLVDLLIACFLVFACQTAVTGLVAGQLGIQLPAELAELSPAARAAVLLGAAGAMTAAFVLSVLVVVLRTRAGLADLGLDWRNLAADLWLGCIAFAMLAPIVYLIQLLLVRWMESKHPLVELLRENPDARFFLVSAVAAVVVAPVAEEYFFRVLLQGWLERVAVVRGDLRQTLLGGVGVSRRHEAEGAEPSSGVPPLQGAVPAEGQPAGDVAGTRNPYQPPRSAAASIASQGPERRQAWPILFSSAVFALAHYSHGPDPIPLFVLALGLGYIYQRTRRIVPCIVVHFLLNSCSLAVLWLVVYSGEQPPG